MEGSFTRSRALATAAATTFAFSAPARPAASAPMKRSEVVFTGLGWVRCFWKEYWPRRNPSATAASPPAIRSPRVVATDSARVSARPAHAGRLAHDLGVGGGAQADEDHRALGHQAGAGHAEELPFLAGEVGTVEIAVEPAAHAGRQPPAALVPRPLRSHPDEQGVGSLFQRPGTELDHRGHSSRRLGIHSPSAARASMYR